MYRIRLIRSLLKNKISLIAVAAKKTLANELQGDPNLFKKWAEFFESLFSKTAQKEEDAAPLLFVAQQRWHKKSLAKEAGSGHSWFGLRSRRSLLARVVIQEPVLDLGCGNGSFFLGCFPQVKNLTGIEADETSLMQAKENGYASVLHQSILAPLPDFQFESITCFEVLQYVKGSKLTGLFKNTAKASTKTAKLHLIIPNRNSFLHRLRKNLGFGREDYVHDHDVAFTLSAAQEAGWSLVKARQVAFGGKRPIPLEIHRPSFFCTTFYLELERCFSIPQMKERILLGGSRN